MCCQKWIFDHSVGWFTWSVAYVPLLERRDLSHRGRGSVGGRGMRERVERAWRTTVEIHYPSRFLYVRLAVYKYVSRISVGPGRRCRHAKRDSRIRVIVPEDDLMSYIIYIIIIITVAVIGMFIVVGVKYKMLRCSSK